MGAYYGDSSALVKRYANETGTRWVRSLSDPQAGHDIFIFTAHITGIEVVAAMALAEQHTLRGYDAVQLASALVLHAELAASGISELVFLSADTALNEVARIEHLFNIHHLKYVLKFDDGGMKKI